ncbi:GTPase-activating protein RGD2 [Kluyveromyces lactis]|uniref:KLLA0D05819p n=1 Tax=Kluyveromyces lactis (strain ATCC 8585 / CBS 2359 / DSM 70799 / NBRC 1267 / NRRL Y-1140 / WM37) TaxID=284590 RepID=Q6CRW8_KLULA|nr:uncharacterized protein KLLA0_D05819g [Kluyveromyces lactis]CAH00417.1 KLLA0D05819p [Kluyveromyces lactis]|eukprot:XP_453321.1 uncharacterized protein KLLA0_D05819g [Kluyveromyces lactis]
MPSFAESFWSPDFISGIEALFGKLHKGCDQNDLFIQLFASRMQYEVEFGRHLCNINKGVDEFDALDSTCNSSLAGMIGQMVEEGNHHLKIASTIEMTVLGPFTKWRQEHKQRVQYSEKILKTNARSFLKSKGFVEKLEQTYLNKCRLLEDFKRSTFNEDELSDAMKSLDLQREHEAKVLQEKEYQKFGVFGGIDYDYKGIKETLKLLLTKLPKHQYKVPFISFTIENTNSGSEIVAFLMTHMSLKDIDHAELFGQDLLNHGFIKYCNGVGTTFANSKKFQYQWKPYAYKFCNLSTTDANDDSLNEAESGIVNYFQKMTAGNEATYSSIHQPNFSDNEKKLYKFVRDVEVSDSKYMKECKKLDSLRCSFEELIVDHYTFMEKCESDRLMAIRKVTLDFCAAIGNTISSMKLTIEKLTDSEALIDPAADLLKTIEENRVGFFQPRVIPYNNYYNPGSYQTFGIDLETRCRSDNRLVPLILSAILLYMDQAYPEMENDYKRAIVWTKPVKLHEVHQLRQLLIKPFKEESEIIEILRSKKVEPSTVASVFKIYLLELPKSLITEDAYDILKVLYREYPPSDIKEETENQRVRGLTTALSTLSKSNMVTLDVITTHFERLIEIIRMNKSEESQELAENLRDAISQEFANCLIHPILPTANELGYKVFEDLLRHRKKIFKELKRKGSNPSSRG